MSRKPQQIGKRGYIPCVRKQAKNEIAELLFRRQKRELIKRGIIQDPANRPAKYKFTWEYGNLGGVVYADGRSEARAILKRNFGITKKKRLPKEVKITREVNIGEDNENSTGSTGTDSDSQHQRTKACPTL